MLHSTRLQRWCLITLLGLFIGLLLTDGVPMLAYRFSLAVHRARQDASDERLQQQLARLSETSQVFRTVTERIKPAVVHIESLCVHDQARQSGERASSSAVRGLIERRQGTGVIVDSRGLVVTSSRLVMDAGEFSVRLCHPPRTFRGTILGSDPGSDLALIRIDAGGMELPTAKLADSDHVAVGDWVLALGNPFGAGPSVAAGIVSAKGKSGALEHLDIEDFIQTDAAIDAGNCGGPLLNLQGEVVGINSLPPRLGEPHDRVGFAIPANLVRLAVDELRAHGQVHRGWLGVILHPLPGEVQGLPAVHVDYVLPGQPAHKSGVQAGDVIVRFQGQSFRDPRELRRMIARSKPSSSVQLVVHRSGRELQLDVIVDPQPKHPIGLPGEKEFGLLLAALTPDVAQRLRLEGTEGVVVYAVHPNSSGVRQIAPGDVIVAANGHPTPTLHLYAKEVDELIQANEAVQLDVRNASGTRQVTFEIQSIAR